MSAYRQTTSAPNEIVTFNFDDSPVFIKRPETYQEAIDTAKKEFPQLAHLPSARVGFALNDIVHGGRHVRVSEGAWLSITEKIPGGTIINVLVLPDLDTKAPPPRYLDVPVPRGNGSKDTLSSDLNLKKSSSSSYLSIRHPNRVPDCSLG
ncbi:hypothetical protein BJ912DRAFT_857344 [Pholiota molesta]|nr:hypothetical protein BJ912DRAFT_857344 [Pholiota molesta]